MLCSENLQLAAVQIHWLRVILDEGHMLGASLSMTNKLQMACALKADRHVKHTAAKIPLTMMHKHGSCCLSSY